MADLANVCFGSKAGIPIRGNIWNLNQAHDFYKTLLRHHRGVLYYLKTQITFRSY